MLGWLRSLSFLLYFQRRKACLRSRLSAELLEDRVLLHASIYCDKLPMFQDDLVMQPSLFACPVDGQLPENFSEWTIAERGGTANARGNVVVKNNQAVLHEGDSFNTLFSQSFTLSQPNATLNFSFASVSFDPTSTGVVKDAFEAALLDDAGNSLVPTFLAGRDAFFNITEGLTTEKGALTTVQGQNVALNLASVPVGTKATLVFRLVNNDADSNSKITLASVTLPSHSEGLAPTKFFVVDAATPTTFKYGDEGLSSGSFSRSVGASARGVASNAAGDTVWIVEGTSGTISIQSSAGTSKGTWVASDAIAPQGVAVANGALWLVDRATNRILRYDGGAARLSGSASASFTFALDGLNASPSDLVTDGTAIWVTDDVRAEVFVYSTVGAILGRWKLDGDNAAPSGITLNPSGGKDLWVVDRTKGAVFHYVGGIDVRSGAQAASDTFMLAAGNASAEGIADPPSISAFIGDPIGFNQAAGNPPVAVDFDNLDPGTVLSQTPINGAFFSTRIDSASLTVVRGGETFIPGAELDASHRLYPTSGVNILSPGGAALALGSNPALEKDNLTITLSSPVSAIALDVIYESLDGSSLSSVTVFDSSGGILFVQDPIPIEGPGAGAPSGSQFVGFVASDPVISRIVIAEYDDDAANPDSNIGFDTIRFFNRNRPPEIVAEANALVFDLETESSVVLNGIATAFAPAGGGQPDRNWITHVTVNGKPVDVLDESGRFFAKAEVQLGRNYFDIVAFDSLGQSAATRVEVEGRIRYELVDRPEGMTIDGTSGLISWLPTAQRSDPVSVEVKAKDADGLFDIQSFAISVVSSITNGTPVIVSSPRRLAQEGLGYFYDLAASDPENDPVVWALVKAPIGASIDSIRGRIRWTPVEEQEGTAEFIVSATDAFGNTATQHFAVMVSCENQPPIITSVPPTVAHFGNVYFYPVRAIDPEGDALRFALAETKPQGMSIDPVTGVVRWTPSASQIDTFLITVTVTDSAGNAANQTFRIVVDNEQPNRNPIIDSAPKVRAATGIAYEYQVAARDPDGDALTYQLVNPPVGIDIGPQGKITWASPTVGTPTINVRVSDGRGGFATQSFLLSVTANLPPKITSNAVTTVQAGAPYRYDVRATDPEGGPLTYQLVGPAGMQIDKLGRITWSASFPARSETVTITVTDEIGQSATQSFSLAIQPDTTAPAVQILLFPDRVNKGGTGRIQVLATDNVGVVSRTLERNGKFFALDSAGVAALASEDTNELGTLMFTAKAIDAAGNVGMTTGTLYVVDPLAPEPKITFTRLEALTPTGHNLLDPFSPTPSVSYLTDVYGSIIGQGNQITSYQVMVARMDQVDLNGLDPYDPDWQVIGTGNGPIVNGKIGTFDPTLLQNDTYVVSVLAFDAAGNGRIEGFAVNVTGNAKLGEFRLEFTDLSLPLAGIPIQVSRIYDTRDTRDTRDSKDFGYGWTLGVANPKLREAVAQDGGDGLFTTAAPYRIGTKVYLTNSRGERVGFTLEGEPGVGFLGGFVYPKFVPDPGVTDTLEVDRLALTQAPDGTLRAFAFGFGYNPDDFRLITQEGLTYHYNQESGLRKITDRNGNVVTCRTN